MAASPAPADTSAEAAAVRAQYDAMQQAMIDADGDALDRLLADDWVAVHITGVRQSKQEYIQTVTSGEFDYHSMTPQDIRITVDGNRAHLTGRNRIDVTINGSRGTYTLDQDSTYEKRDGTWIRVS